MAKTFKLREVKEPKFEVEFAEGDVRSFDPWELQEKIADLQSGDHSLTNYDAVRRAVGLPTQAESDAADGGSEQKFTLTRQQALELEVALAEFTNELPVSKKVLSMFAASPASTAKS